MLSGRKSFLRLSGLAAISGFFATGAQAIFTIDITQVTMTYMPVPAGPTPYAQAVFEQQGANTVKLTMKNLLAVSGAEIIGWYFNVNLSATDIAGMTFTHSSGQVVNSVTKGSNFSHGIDSSSKAGLFDIVFNFPPPPGNDKFAAGETSVWIITGNGLTENSFNTLSAPEGSNPGGWTSVIRIQSYTDVNGNGPGNSASLGDGGGTPQSVPEPITTAFMGAGALAAFRKLRRRRANA